MNSLRSAVLLLSAWMAFACPSARAAELPQELEGVGITSQLGTQVSIHQLQFRDENGVLVPLSQYFKSGKPVILNLVYYECPNLCGLVLSGLLAGLKQLNWSVGNEFEIISVSIDPKEGPNLARDKKSNYLDAYRSASPNRTNSEAGWHFLTGDESQIKRLASEVGFGYRYDQEQKQYAHGAAIFVLTPSGILSRVLNGVEYSAKNLKLSLLEASNGKVGTLLDRALMFCFRYDPSKRGYSFYAFRLVQVTSAAGVLALGLFLFIYFRRQRTRVAMKGAN